MVGMGVSFHGPDVLLIVGGSLASAVRTLSAAPGLAGSLKTLQARFGGCRGAGGASKSRRRHPHTRFRDPPRQLFEVRPCFCLPGPRGETKTGLAGPNKESNPLNADE